MSTVTTLLTDDQFAVVETTLDFAQEHLAPHAVAWDQDKHFPVDVLRKAAGLGLGGVYVREDLGGSELTCPTGSSPSRPWPPAAPPSRAICPSTTWSAG